MTQTPLVLHQVFESLGYLVGFTTYRRQRLKSGDHLSSLDRLWVIAAAVIGAAIGSEVLYWLEDPAATVRHWHDAAYLLGGKTLVGALLGGLAAVELAKARLGIRRRTGDLFAVPLALGIAVGRVGCFLAGLRDHTYGVPTSLPWGVDFGDGLRRHPTQIYEIGWCLLLAVWLAQFQGRPYQEGDVFKAFMIGYLGFRLAIECLKPGVPMAGLTAIQWACVGALLYYGRDFMRIFARQRVQAA